MTGYCPIYNSQVCRALDNKPCLVFGLLCTMSTKVYAPMCNISLFKNSKVILIALVFLVFSVLQCYNCSGPCPNASGLNLTGLPPIMSQPVALKDKSGGFQDTRHFIQHNNVEEAQSQTISKCECASPLYAAFLNKLSKTEINSKNIL